MTTHLIKDKTFTLEGFQSAFKPGKYGTCGIKVIVDQDTVDMLEKEREDMISNKISKQSDPKRWLPARTTKWTDVAEDKYSIGFSWKPDQAPIFVDSEGTVITEEIPLYSGSRVRIKFDHYAYPDNTRKEVNTTCKLVKVQVVSCSNNAGVDSGDLDFDKTEGFKIGSPRVVPAAAAENDDDF